MKRKKLAAIVCAHTYPEVAELSIGSFLRAHPGYEIDLHVGIHSNYIDYCKDLRLFSDLRGLAQIHLVDEIDWLGAFNECWFRYSVMHAKNLENLLKQARYGDFDHVVILDHDVLVKSDFVTPLLEENPDADLIGALFEDRAGLKPYTTSHNESLYSAPKVSVWHALLSRKLFEEILKNPSRIYPKILSGDDRKPYVDTYRPEEDRPIFVDTFAEIYQLVVHGNKGFKSVIVPASTFWPRVEHFYNSSFNYGYWTRRDSYPAHVERIAKIFRKEFPEGLAALRRLDSER